MGDGRLARIRDLAPGDHACCIYESEEEHRAAIAPFLSAGLRAGQKVECVLDAHPRETMEQYLRDEGVDPDAALERGQLVFLAPDDTYLRSGAFDPDAVIALWKEETDKAIDEGYPALRVTGEVTWILRNPDAAARFIEYEAKVNRFFHSSRCLAICQYDRTRFGADMLLDVLATHPVVAIGQDLYENHCYLPPEKLLGPCSDALPSSPEFACCIHA